MTTRRGHPRNRPALRGIAGWAEGAEIEIPDSGLVVGRRDSDTPELAGDRSLSGRHAEINWSNGELLIRDLGSTNGTWLNGEQVRDYVPLYAGDEIRLGDTSFELVAVPSSFEPRPRHGELRGRDRLGRLAAVAAILAAIATTIGVGYTIFVRPNSEVADYQKQVLATCEQVRAIVTADHSEVLQPGPDGIRVNKDLLLRIAEGNLAQARESFDALNRRAVPDDLADEHDAAVDAQDAWSQAMQGVLETIRSEVPEDATLQEWTSMGVDLGGGRTAITRLNSAMTGLAGENCSVS